jgi:hypothetical protein
MKVSRGKLIGLKRSPYGEESYDSDLEKYYMVELEGMPGVKTWTKRHSLKIPYQFFFIKHNYIPDFLVELNDGSKEIHETKGLPFLFLLSTKLKKVSAEEYCKKMGWKYKFITKDKEVFYKNNFLSASLGTIQDIKL